LAFFRELENPRIKSGKGLERVNGIEPSCAFAPAAQRVYGIQAYQQRQTRCNQAAIEMLIYKRGHSLEAEANY
jgi:hypothetical protein